MNIHTLRWLVLFTAMCGGQQVAAAGAQFAADMVQKAGGRTHTMRYYHGDQKMRTEMKTEDGQQAISIIDLKARKMLQLMPDNRMYMEIPLGGDTAAWAADDQTRQEYYEMKHAGTEKVNGYVCDKYILIPKKPELEKSTTWIAQKLGYPIKSVGQSYSMELTNIKEGTQAASLFTVPKDYQKMPGMEDYYRGMMQQGGGTSAPPPDAAGKGDDGDVSEAIGKGLRGLFGK
jgi:outer membrane lipoprotein-sorting protein